MESKQPRLFVKRKGFKTQITTILKLDNYLTITGHHFGQEFCKIHIFQVSKPFQRLLSRDNHPKQS